ncbi:MAG TPA: site-2 protease family protein [Terriglobales bacterium]|nr:site-2 protease family protein [Terriglobales bacterium]
MRIWSIPAGRLFGTDIRIHVTFLFLLFFVWLTESGPHGPVYPARGVALVGIVLASVMAHEFTHLFTALKFGVIPKSVVLLPLGGVSMVDETQQAFESTPESWKKDIRIAAVGPVANLAIAFVAGAIVLNAAPQVNLWAHPYLSSAHLVRSFVWCNLGLGLLNLIPAYPLDGGRVLRAVFSMKTNPIHATRRAVSIGQSIAMVFMLAGMVQYFERAGMESAWVALIGFFLLLAAQLEERSAVFHSVLETVHLEDIMLTDFASLSPADTLEDALNKAVHCLQDDFPVIRGGDMVGIISRQKIVHALRAEGNGYVQSAMNRIFDVAQKKESLASAFRKLSSRNLSLIPIVEEQRLVGIVTLQNLMHSMALLAESRRLRGAAE